MTIMTFSLKTRAEKDWSLNLRVIEGLSIAFHIRFYLCDSIEKASNFRLISHLREIKTCSVLLHTGIANICNSWWLLHPCLEIFLMWYQNNMPSSFKTHVNYVWKLSLLSCNDNGYVKCCASLSFVYKWPRYLWLVYLDVERGKTTYLQPEQNLSGKSTICYQSVMFINWYLRCFGSKKAYA